MFLDSLAQQKNPADRISCVIYNSNSRIVFRDQVPTSALNNQIQMVSGGTNYAPALEDARKITKDSHANFSKIIYYFMSDGHPWDEIIAINKINEIKKEPWISKVEFLAVGFGGGYSSSFPVLERMAAAFPNGKM